jgi:hypothetical protein
MNRRTAAIAGIHVIKVIKGRRIMSGAIMVGRGQCRKGGAENNRSRKRNLGHAEHFRISRSSFAANDKICRLVSNNFAIFSKICLLLAQTDRDRDKPDH